jgi:N-acetyl-alpha-D-glucosaminyl L-malate synthase BshA
MTNTAAGPTARAVRVGFVMHIMQVAGAETLVAEIIRRLGARIDPVVFCLDGVGPLGEQLESEGVPVIAYGRRAGLDVGLAWRMGRDLARMAPDVLHAHQYTPFFYAALARVASMRRIRILLTEHGRHYPDFVSTRRRLINRLVLQRLADRVSAVCQFSADSLVRLDGFDRQPVEVIENGIEVERYQRNGTPDAAGRVGGDRRLVVHVARFHPVKDHGTLVRAFAIVAREVRDADLALVGDGPERGAIERLVNELGITDRVRFLGVRSDVEEILRQAAVFTLPSISEAASLTLMEAMATGLPSVVTAVGGNPELVRDGVDGVLVPRSDPAALATALTRLLKDPVLAAQMGRAAAARARERYRLERTVARYHELYEALRG